MNLLELKSLCSFGLFGAHSNGLLFRFFRNGGVAYAL